MKILNLFAGIGGNRELWAGHDITSVEFEPTIAEVYKKRFPADEIVVADALEYVQAHYAKYDFIWASPPCPSHGQYRHNVGVLGKGYAPVIPDMTSLYGLITFLKTYHKGKWCVENTRPYYEPLIKPSFEIRRHLFWANFNVSPFAGHDVSDRIREKNKISDFEGGEIVSESRIANKRQVLRNCVNPEIGQHILKCACSYNPIKSEAELFDWGIS